MLYSFEDFSLDTARRELRRSGALIAIQPQVFDLLEYSIRHRERVVSKDDLLAAVWNGRIVSESTLSTRINAARSAIGDSGGEQRLLRTAHGKGIRFVGSVREEEETVRKLAAIFAADVEGYSRLMGQDEVGTLRRLTACRVLLDELISAHRGRIFGSAGGDSRDVIQEHRNDDGPDAAHHHHGPAGRGFMASNPKHPSDVEATSHARSNPTR